MKLVHWIPNLVYYFEIIFIAENTSNMVLMSPPNGKQQPQNYCLGH